MSDKKYMVDGTRAIAESRAIAASPVQGAASMAGLVQSKQGEPAHRMAELTQGAASASADAFREHLDKCSATVATWPAWKRDQGSTGAKGAAYLTDAELADPVFVRAYIEGCNDSFAEVLAENVKLRAALAERAQAAQPSGAVAEYKPGRWFDARTLDEMQAFYLSRLPAIREAAREHGYAIGLHGSQRRDFDLMAMQWRDGASDKDTLAHAIAVAACGITSDGAFQWERKPSGRFAVSLPICWTDDSNPNFDKPSVGHIDLSIIDFATPAPEQEAAPTDLRKAAQSVVASFSDPHVSLVAVQRQVNMLADALAAPVEQEAAQVVAKADDPPHVAPPFGAPAGQHEVTRLDLLSLIHSQMHRVYASAIDREEVDTKYMVQIEEALRAVYARAELASGSREGRDGGNESGNLGAANTSNGGEA